MNEQPKRDMGPPEADDALAFLGVVLIGMGTALWSVPAALIVVGVIVLGLAAAAARKG